MAKQFGFAGYAVREVSVSSEMPQNMPVYAKAMSSRAAASFDESLPVEAGKATVTVSVNGSVQMTK